MLVVLIMIVLMVMEFIYGQMGKNMKGNENKIK